MTYSVVEVFKTLQGEGYFTGRPAVFLRLAGCNMWSGFEEHRVRDSGRNHALCPLWCDTDFIAKHRGLAPQQVLDMVRAVAGNVRFIVITGGEPFMQLEPVLVELLVRDGFFIAVETNGSVDRKVEADWVTCSPKQPPETFSRFEACDELKVIFPSYDPHAYASRIMAKFNYVQPLAVTTGVGKSLIDRGNMARAVEWVLQNPGWRLSLQTHKMVGLP